MSTSSSSSSLSKTGKKKDMSALETYRAFSTPETNFSRATNGSKKTNRGSGLRSYKNVKSKYMTPKQRNDRQAEKDGEKSENKTDGETVKKGSVAKTAEIRVKNFIPMVDHIFGALNTYMRVRGLRLSDVFGALDSDHEGFLRACPEKRPDLPPPVMTRMQKMDPTLMFNDLEVETWILFMNRGHRKDKSYGRDKATRKVSVRVTFNDFSACFKQYLRKRASKSQTRTPKRIEFKTSTPIVSSTYASRRIRSETKSKDSPQTFNSNVETQRRERDNELRQQQTEHLQLRLDAEKRKKTSLGRKLASTTLSAVEKVVDEVLREPIPTVSSMVFEIPDQHWKEHERAVEEEYAELKSNLPHYGTHLTTGGSGGGLYFGARRGSSVYYQAPSSKSRRASILDYTAAYYEKKYDISARRLESESQELEHTMTAIEDCEREIEAGEKELAYKQMALKNAEYKTRALLWLLERIASQKDGSEDHTFSMPLSRPTITQPSSTRATLDDNGRLVLADGVTMGAFVDEKMAEISAQLPRWSAAFKGEDTTPASLDDSTLDVSTGKELLNKMRDLMTIDNRG